MTKYTVSHFDSAQTDNFPYAVTQGTRTLSPLALPQVIGGPINIMTMASTSPNFMWGVSTTGVNDISTANNAFTPVARMVLPGATVIAETLLVSVLNQPFSTIEQIQMALQSLGLGNNSGFGLFGGVYSVVDNNNDLYVNYMGYIHAINLVVPGLPLLGIYIHRSLNTASFLQSGESVTGLSMTYDGHLIVTGGRSISVVKRDFTGTVHRIAFANNETVSNSIAVDENNGIYVVTDNQMHKLIWTGTQLSQSAADGAWSSPYPTGDTFPTLFGAGAGATPTLMGFGNDPDKLVVITDGKKRMGLVAFWRNEIPAGFTDRIAGQIQVTCGLPPGTTYIQSDQSVAIKDYGAFVVNNISEDSLTGVILVDAIARGPILASPSGWNVSNGIRQRIPGVQPGPGRIFRQTA